MIGNILKNRTSESENGFGMVCVSSEASGNFSITATAEKFFITIRDGDAVSYISNGTPQAISFQESSSPGKDVCILGCLTSLVVGDAQVGAYSFSVSGMDWLKSLQLNSTSIGSFSGIKLPRLEHLKISEYSNVSFTELDASGTPELRSIDLSGCPSLKKFHLSKNRKLESITLNGCSSISEWTFPKFNSVPFGNEGLRYLDTTGTGLSIDALIQVLPFRNDAFPGALYTDETATSAEEAALSEMHWTLGQIGGE